MLEFRTATGDVCCRTDDPACKARAATLPTPTVAKTDDYDSMAAYRRGMKKSVAMRAATDDVYRNPPNGYVIALEQRRQEAR